MRPVRTRPKKVSGTQTLHGDSEDDSGTDQDGGDKSDAEYGSPPNDEASSDVENKRQKKPKKPKAKQKSEERKINPNAVAHANFKSLKIKNKNSKGKGRGFRRR